MIKRSQLKILLQRIENEPRRHIQVLYGPRQVGKTTLVRQLMDQTLMTHHYASADGITGSTEFWISSQWETARLMTQEGIEGLLILDEVQKIPNWSELIKQEWDRDTINESRLKVVLLGSSRLLLQQGLTESLTGRFETLYLPHWSYKEMKELADISIDEYIWFGGYPGSVDFISDESRWKQYIRDSIIDTSISRDILMLTRVDKPALIRQLFEIGCSYSSQIISFNKVLGQLNDAGNTTTLSHYLRLLDQAGLLGGLSRYSPELIRQRASIPKFQVHNMALISALEPSFFDDVRADHSRWGRWLESAIGCHLINQCTHHHARLYYWRDKNDEVDFIIEKERKIIAIEIKLASAKKSGLSEFAKKYQPHKSLLVGQSGMPVEDFLNADIENLFQ